MYPFRLVAAPHQARLNMHWPAWTTLPDALYREPSSPYLWWRLVLCFRNNRGGLCCGRWKGPSGHPSVPTGRHCPLLLFRL